MTRDETPDGTLRTRRRLELSTMLVVAMLSGLGVLLVQHKLVGDAETNAQRGFQHTLDAQCNVQSLRHAMLLERCRELARRIGERIEPETKSTVDIYRVARGILKNFVESQDESERESSGDGFHAEFCRFLGSAGHVVASPAAAWAGWLTSGETTQLRPSYDGRELSQLGYLRREQPDEDGPIFDLIAVPVFSDNRHQVLMTLIFGFEPASRLVLRQEPGIIRGIWLQGELYLSGLPSPIARKVADAVRTERKKPDSQTYATLMNLDRGPHMMLFEPLNRDSSYPIAYQVCLFPLTELRARQVNLRRQVSGIGALLLSVGLIGSHLLAARFALPVETLVKSLAEQRKRRRHAEAAFAQAARFSADASHQLKTPVSVLRATLQDIPEWEQISPALREELKGLVGQTYRLSGLIDDLLLLSRMEAGQLQITRHTIDLAYLLDLALDDLSVLPDPLALTIKKECPTVVPVLGDKRYLGLILQNLLENARKYNRPNGLIYIKVCAVGEWVHLIIGNSAQCPIPADTKSRIFERFHRGRMAENIPGYGLGLNLARELARLHGGELTLLRSDEKVTEFEVQLPCGVPGQLG